MAHYKITVLRGTDKGTLSFESGTVKVHTTCWWDPKVVINAGVYTGYATRMAGKTDGLTGNKKREAIWFGLAVPYNNGSARSKEFFIHKGNNPGWSDGCIVARESQVFKIWNAIQPKEHPVVEITIIDEGRYLGRPRGCRLTA